MPVAGLRGDEGGGVLRGAEHRLEPRRVDRVGGQLGGDDQAVGGGDVLGVVALDEPAAADGHQPGVGVGDVAVRVAAATSAACAILPGSGRVMALSRAAAAPATARAWLAGGGKQPGSSPSPAARRWTALASWS